MLLKRFSTFGVFTVLAAGLAFAQPKPATQSAAPGIAPGVSSKPMTATATPSQPATSTARSAASGNAVNLNTATAQQLDALPDVGSARTKAIMTEREKGKFKDWNDFESRMAHSSVNKGVQAKIKDHVTF
jgi:competence protein ComEA